MNSNLITALVLAGIIVVWMLTGLTRSNEEDLSASQDSEQAVRVQSASSQAEEYVRAIHVRARTEAERQVSVAAELDGLVEESPIEEGQLVDKGQVLCRLHSEDREARMKQAEAQLKKAQLDYDAALKLQDSGYQSRSQIASAGSSLALAEAELERAKISTSRLSVVAPFRGVVQKRLTEVGAFLQRGMACAELLELDPLIVAGEVNEQELPLLSRGDRAKVRLSSGQMFEGTLRYLASAPTSSTNTFRVEVSIPNPDMRIPAGLTAEIEVHTRSMQAHKVSPSLFVLRDGGKLGLRVVNSARQVEEYEVELVADAPNGVWVTGLPDEVELITVGQEYVGVGETVEIVPVASDEGAL